MLENHQDLAQESTSGAARASLEEPTSRSTASILNATRGLDQLLHTAHQQRIRQLRKIQQLRRHSEATAALHRSWQLKQEQEEEQQRQRQLERQQAAKAKQRHEQLIEKRRLEVAAAAEEHADRVRAAHHAKQVKADQQAALALQRKRKQATELKKRSQMVALRNEEVHHKSEEILEQKKQALRAKEELQQEHLRNVEADRQIRESERAQAKARRIVEAQRAQQRAALDLQHKTAYFQSKKAAEEAKLMKKQEESEAVREQHRQEARQREQVYRHRLDAKAKRDEANRAQLSRKTANKMARADLIEAQKQALLLEMQHIRKDILQQEAWLKDGFEKMEVTGRFELPQELLDLESSGLLEAAVLDRTRGRQDFSFAPSPDFYREPQDPPRPTSAYTDRQLYNESSRKSLKNASTAKRPVTAHASIPGQARPNSYAQQASLRRGKDSIKAQYQPEEASGNNVGLDYTSEGQNDQEQLNKLLQDEQVKEVERESILSQAADERERQQLLSVISSERGYAQQNIEAVAAQAGA